ncbi:chromatin modification-related protein Eaf6p [Diutina catenulata]
MQHKQRVKFNAPPPTAKIPPKEQVKTEASESDKYTKLKDDLVKEILKKQELEKKLSDLEDQIYDKENDYFNESVYGNIIKGFDNFSKASGSTAKKRLQYSEDDHIFSLSSTNYLKQMMKKQGTANGTTIDDYEDVVEPRDQGAGSPSVPAAPSDDGSASSPPARKRKSRIPDE